MKYKSGRSSAWLERYVRDVEVARSNRVAPISPLGFFLAVFSFLALSHTRRALDLLYLSVIIKTPAGGA